MESSLPRPEVDAGIIGGVGPEGVGSSGWRDLEAGGLDYFCDSGGNHCGCCCGRGDARAGGPISTLYSDGQEDHLTDGFPV